MAGAASDFVGIAQGGEIQQAEVVGALAGGDRLLAGGAAEDHLYPLCGEGVDVGLRGFGLGGAVAGQQLQRLAEQAAGGIELGNRQQGAAVQLQALGLVIAAVRVIEADGDRLGQQAHTEAVE